MPACGGLRHAAGRSYLASAPSQGRGRFRGPPWWFPHARQLPGRERHTMRGTLRRALLSPRAPKARRVRFPMGVGPRPPHANYFCGFPKPGLQSFLAGPRQYVAALSTRPTSAKRPWARWAARPCSQFVCVSCPGAGALFAVALLASLRAAFRAASLRVVARVVRFVALSIPSPCSSPGVPPFACARLLPPALRRALCPPSARRAVLAALVLFCRLAPATKPTQERKQTKPKNRNRRTHQPTTPANWLRLAPPPITGAVYFLQGLRPG